MGGMDADERRYLCKKCHTILHSIIPSIIWKYIPLEERELIKKTVKYWTLHVWLKEVEQDDSKTITRGQV